MKILERVAIVVTSLLLAGGLIAVLSGFFTSHDPGSINGSTGGPGQTFPDLGNRILAPGELRPPYNSDPPTSGPHIPTPVTQDSVPLSNDQLLSALSLGNVVLVYGSQRLQAPLESLATGVAGRFTPSLAAAGQAVILTPRRGTNGVIALAWDHMLRVPAPTAAGLREFATFWLGRVAPRPVSQPAAAGAPQSSSG